MKNETKRKMVAGVMTAIITLTPVAAVTVLTGCGTGGTTQETAKAQTGTIEVQLDVKRNVTVKGDSFTDTQWNKIKADLTIAINDAYTAALPGTARIKFDSIFGQPGGVTINVDKTPSGYTNWKTTGDSKTLYIANGKITAANITAGVNSMDADGTEFVRAIVPQLNRQSIAFANNIAKRAVSRSRLG